MLKEKESNWVPVLLRRKTDFPHYETKHVMLIGMGSPFSTYGLKSHSMKDESPK